jgi:hypothetical protein
MRFCDQLNAEKTYLACSKSDKAAAGGLPQKRRSFEQNIRKDSIMKLLQKSLLASAMLAAVVAPSFAQVQEFENCKTRFQSADVNGDGSLGGVESQRFYERKWKTDTKPSDAPIISRQEFLTDCGNGEY